MNIGEKEFIKLFKQYYELAEKTAPTCQTKPQTSGIDKPYSGNATPIPGYSLWEQSAVSSTSLGENIVAVRIFVPHGNLTSVQMHQLATLAECGSAPYFRLTRSQDLLIPQVQRSVLPEIYRILVQDFANIDLIGDSFKGHIVSCIGSTLCKIGILDSPKIAEKVATELDELFKDTPDRRATLLPRIVDSIRISGCLNACGAHPAATIGVQGGKKKLAGELEEVGLVFSRNANQPLGKPENEFVPVSEIPSRLRKMVEELILAVE